MRTDIAAQRTRAHGDIPGQAVAPNWRAYLRLSRHFRWFAEAVAVAATTTTVFLAYFKPWTNGLRVPFSYSGDGNFHAMLVKTMIERGWYESTPLLGAPYGQNLNDFPLGGDHLQLVILKLLSFGTRDPYLVLNAYTAIAFILIALVAHGVLRHLGVRPLLAGVLSVLYAFLPYHLWHLPHFFLAAYFSVPLGVVLTLWVLDDGVPLVTRLARSWPARDRRRRLGIVALIVLVIGSADGYYAIFTALLLLSAAMLETIRRRCATAVLTAVIVAAAIGVVALANMAPELSYQRDHGANRVAAHRTAAESEYYGLPIANLVLPQPGYRTGRSTAGTSPETVAVDSEGGIYLGVIGATGLVLALALGLSGSLGRTYESPLIRRLALIIVAALGLGTIGGLGYLIALVGFTQVRAWNRIVIFIAFAAFAALGVLTNRWLGEHLWSSKPRRIGALLLAAVVLVGGILDQAPTAYRPHYSRISAEKRSDSAFVAQMEASLPRGAMVFQLPAMAFPENVPVVRIIDYDLLKGYLMGSGRLRWSYGGMKGRSADWYTDWAAQQPPVRMITGVTAAGFDALYVDTYGYADGGAALNAALMPTIGPPVFQSENGRLRWYDLRSLRAKLKARFTLGQLHRLRRAVISPLGITWGKGVFPSESDSGGVFRWMSNRGSITLENGGTSRHAHLRLRATGPIGAALVITGPGATTKVALTPTGAPIDLRFRLAPGTTSLRFSTNAPTAVPNDPREIRIQLRDTTIGDAVVDALLPGRGTPS